MHVLLIVVAEHGAEGPKGSATKLSRNHDGNGEEYIQLPLISFDP